MVKCVFIITHKSTQYPVYQGQSLFLIMKLQMWPSVRGNWNTINLFYKVAKIKFPFYVPHEIS